MRLRLTASTYRPPWMLLTAPLLVALATTGVAAAQVTTPEAHLGRPVGADFELADWSEVAGYYRKLASESPRVRVETVGTTTEGRDFLLATISSEANLGRIEEIRAAAKRIADPRGMGEDEREALLARARPILFVSIGMHSTETAAPQFGMEFAHRLATSDEEPYRSAREDMVVLIAPCLNPDGLDHVVSWYRETVGTPYEATGLLKLYQYYAGHDNNRDWFMLSQAETQIVTRLLYSEWYPHVYWDVHQQGRSSERFFVPPFRDPLNPNLDAGVITGIGQLGARALFDMTREGYSGVSTGVSYDMWWNGGNRNVPVRHNIIGLLTEAASVNIASPVFLTKRELSAPGDLSDYAASNRFPKPWPGGWWRLRDIIEYEHAFSRSLVGSITRESRLWLENSLSAAERAIRAGQEDAPRAWILPSERTDRGATRRLAKSLLLGGVELHVVDESFEADGRSWPAGSIVIRRAQPYGQHVKDLFEVQRYPDGDAPYDVAGWTLPLLLGVRRVEVMEPIGAALRRVETAAEAVAAFATGVSPGRADSRDSDGWVSVFRRLGDGEALSFETDGVFVTAETAEDTTPEETAPTNEPDEEASEEGNGATEIRVERMPRVGLYAPWSGSMDEGWARFVFDRFGMPFVSVRNEMVRAGDLGDFLDVLVIASISGRQLDTGRAEGSVPPEFARGLDPEGAAAVEEFVRTGGRLIAIGSSAAWAIELFDLPLEDTTRGEDSAEFSCPGSVLRAVPETGNETLGITAGLPASVPVFFSRSSAWREKKDEKEEENGDGDEDAVTVLLRYAPTRVLLSGWIRSPEVIAGHAAWVRAKRGDGSVDLFGFRPQYRGWSQGTFQLLFRAILFGD